MNVTKIKRKAAKNLIARIGASTMPVEVTVFGKYVVQALDPETGSVATFSISDNGRLTCTRFLDKC